MRENPTARGRNSSSSSRQGFWQVVYDDIEVEIVRYRALFTTIALRRLGFSIYADGQFIEIRADARRHPPAGWPATDAEVITNFRTAQAVGGKCELRAAGLGFEVEHTPTIVQDPRDRGKTSIYSMQISGDEARVGRQGSGEVWRRLSGAGSSPLAGAWESVGPNERWLYLVSAGHFAVM